MSPDRQAPGRPAVLVTGASRGVGLALVRAIHAHGGYRPVAAMRGVGGRNGGIAAQLRDLGLPVVEIDVTSDASVADGVAAAVGGRVDRDSRQQRRRGDLRCHGVGDHR